jgi:hypothetical protein
VRSDKAQIWEADMIDMFRNAPARTELVFDRDTPFGPTLNGQFWSATRHV